VKGLAATVVLAVVLGASSTAKSTVSNQRPRLSNVKASIGTVYDEAAAKPRKDGLKLSLRVCDDGPAANSEDTASSISPTGGRIAPPMASSRSRSRAR